jgi:tetratricopeptide (TPR) repeat protein
MAELHPLAPEAGYTREQILRILRLSPRQLLSWEREGLVAKRVAYSLDDLRAIRRLAQLASSRIPLRRIKNSLQAVRERVVGVTQPLSELSVIAVERRVEVNYKGQRMDALSGQLSFMFSAHEAGSNIHAFRRNSPARSAAADEWFMRAVALEEAGGNRDDAAECYRRCLEIDSRYASAYINLGTLRYNQGNFKEAERCYRQALEIDSQYALAYFDLGNVLDETGRLKLAIEAYQRAVRLAPNYADAHYNLALAYEKSGQRRHAIPHWRRYLQLDSVSPWAGHARAQLKRALDRDKLQLVR